MTHLTIIVAAGFAVWLVCCLRCPSSLDVELHLLIEIARRDGDFETASLLTQALSRRNDRRTNGQ